MLVNSLLLTELDFSLQPLQGKPLLPSAETRALNPNAHLLSLVVNLVNLFIKATTYCMFIRVSALLTAFRPQLTPLIAHLSGTSST